MSVTTNFLPSIHGWPFGNSFRKTYAYGQVKLDMGFCGGMCWRALHRFVHATPIPRDLAKPKQGDALFDELWNAQVDSVTAGTLWKFYQWQMSPDLSHQTNPMHSLGHRTQEDWPDVKNSLDSGMPITISLVASSNDENPAHLDDHHRVIAIGYRITAPGSGAPEGADQQVIVQIYDPNHAGLDDIELSFYLGAKRNKIRLRHSRRGARYHGFFRDDRTRALAHFDPIRVDLTEFAVADYISSTKADFRLTFHWSAPVIPYFELLVGGVSWGGNRGTTGAMQTYAPVGREQKQCPVRTGSMTIVARLQRGVSDVAVRLFGTDAHRSSLTVNATPVVRFLPYVKQRADSDFVGIHDTRLDDDDFFVGNPQPTEQEIRALDTSEFRWVMSTASRPLDRRDQTGDLRTAVVETIDQIQFGNVIRPVKANFDEHYLAPPVQRWCVVKTARRGEPTKTVQLADLAAEGVVLFDGFTRNPHDFVNDARVEVRHWAKDRFGVTRSGVVRFHGKSILHERTSAVYHQFDPSKLGKVEDAARKLAELGLIEAVIHPPRRWVGPRPDPRDPLHLLEQLQDDAELQHLLDQKFTQAVRDVRTWRRVFGAQSDYVDMPTAPLAVARSRRPGGIRRATIAARTAQRRELERLAADVVAGTVVNRITRDPAALRTLMSRCSRF